jgi:hypothetical protein
MLVQERRMQLSIDMLRMFIRFIIISDYCYLIAVIYILYIYYLLHLSITQLDQVVLVRTEKKITSITL